MNDDDTIGTLPIGAVSRATGLSRDAIRVWERRHRAVTPARTAGGSRVYTSRDVERLSALKALTERGHSIGRIAGLSDEDLQDLLVRERGPGVAAHSARFLEALDAFDLAAAERALATAAGVLGPSELAYGVLGPIAREIGDRWESGRLEVFHEHAATAIVRGVVSSVLNASEPAAGAPLAVVTTPSGELHELGALLAALVVRAAHWRVAYLGCSLPADQIARAVATAGATAVLLSLVNERDPATAEQLADLCERLPDHVVVVAGGRSAPLYADVLRRARIEPELRALEPMLGWTTPRSTS